MDLVRFQGTIIRFQVKIHYFGLFWPLRIFRTHPPPKKINPCVEKIFFLEKSLGNDFPCNLSKYELPTPSECRDIPFLRFVFFLQKKYQIVIIL